MTRRDRVAVPGVAAAGARPGRAEEAVWGRAALLHFFGGEQTCPEQDATRGMCSFDLQPQDTLPGRTMPELGRRGPDAMGPQEVWGEEGAGSIPLALQGSHGSWEAKKKAERGDQN